MNLLKNSFEGPGVIKSYSQFIDCFVITVKMCSFIGKGEKFESKINDLIEDLEDKIKDVEFKTEEGFKELR